MKVKRLSTSKKGYGGIIYEKMVDDALSKQFDFGVVSATFNLKGFLRILEVPFYIFRQFKFAKDRSAFLIRSFQSALFNYSGKGLTIVYHIDSTGSPLLARIFQDVVEKVFQIFIKKSEHIVVIAEYWKDYFIQRGHKNVHLIYCGFDVAKYTCSEADVAAFLKKYNLVGKRIVYLGNPQKKKGASLAYEALKNAGYELITTGVRERDLPCMHLDLSFKEYLCLLKSAQVAVLMSQFAEGWNRIAHEALLMGTPVIGTGYGGMGEVLANGGQVICRNPQDLPKVLKEVLLHREQYAVKGVDYARKFTTEKFEADWVALVKKLSQ